MRGDRTNYGQGADLERVTVRLNARERKALIALAIRHELPAEASWADIIKRAIEVASPLA